MPEEKMLYRPEEAARVLSISRAKVYELISSGALRVVHIGRSARVPRGELERFVARLMAEQHGGKLAHGEQQRF